MSKVFDSFVKIAFLAVSRPTIVVGIGIIGIEFNCYVKIINGTFYLAFVYCKPHHDYYKHRHNRV